MSGGRTPKECYDELTNTCTCTCAPGQLRLQVPIAAGCTRALARVGNGEQGRRRTEGDAGSWLLVVTTITENYSRG